MALAFGRYQLLKKLASGGMGQIFLARAAGERGFEKLLVIKRILPHLAEDEEFITMFFDEARIAARLNHPNIVQIFDLGEVDGSYYLAMEYVAGEDLRRLSRHARSEGQPLPLGALCRIVADAAAGLDYAHKAKDAHGPLNLVHRDVSPQNVLVGFDGAVKLIDFGVAKAAGRAQHTATGILKGKYAYMSPEQAEGEEIDHRSDVFALGIVFWEVLTGKRLFKGDTDVMTMRLVKDCAVPPPSRVEPSLPKAVDALVLKALAKHRDHRYPDAKAFQLAIEELALELRLPASAAHLQAHLESLYAERIAQEQDLSSLDQLSPQADLDQASTPSNRASTPGSPFASKVVSAVEPAPPPPETVRTARPQTVALPPKPRRSLGVPVAAGLALVLGAGGFAAWQSLRPPDETPGTIAPVSEPPQMEAPAPKPPPAPQLVSVRVVSEPPGASVEIDGQPMGVTPLELELEVGAAPLAAVLTKEGFEPEKLSLSASGAPERSVALRKRPKRALPLSIKTGR